MRAVGRGGGRHGRRALGGSDPGSVRWSTSLVGHVLGRGGQARAWTRALGLLLAVEGPSSDGESNSQAPTEATSTRLPAATAANNAPRDAQMDGRLRFPDIADNSSPFGGDRAGPRPHLRAAQSCAASSRPPSSSVLSSRSVPSRSPASWTDPIAVRVSRRTG